MIKLTFLGGTGTVTGSKYLVEVGKSKVLIDCGLFQGSKELRLRNWNDFPVSTDEIDAVILTHAHIDHSGYLPLLVRNGFRGKVFSTPGTYDLCKILLPDSGKLQEEEANFANKKSFSKHHPALPLYTRSDAEKTLSLFRQVPFDQSYILNDDIEFRFSRAGHILGAACLILTCGKRTITFSGDLGRPNDLIMLPPDTVEKTDYLVIESTYGDRTHEKTDAFQIVESIVKRTVEKRGALLIPAFSVGRAQTILFILAKLKSENRLPKIPIYLDSPMSIDATELLSAHQGEHRLSPAQVALITNIAKFTHSQEESKLLDQRTDPLIIISASGMATGGRILHHLKCYVSEARNTVLFTGFQAEGTRGATLLSGAGEVKIHGEIVKIEAEVLNLDMISAHADQSETINWLKNFKTPPKKTFITHGEPQASQALQTEIQNTLKWNAVIPKYMDTVELN